MPGDKSISHRAFLLNALGEGSARVLGSNPGEDVASTRELLKKLGVILRRNDEAYVIKGRNGRLRPAVDALDCGNSGTTMRLLAGILAAQDFTTTLTGDESLQRRPMERVALPLRQMGARVDGPDGGRTAPLIISGGPLRGGPFSLEIASAQVKSCILLAAAAGSVEVEVEEPASTRDHTERMLEAMGAEIEFGPGWVKLGASKGLRCVDMEVPGDPSAGALLAAAACAVPGSRLELRGMSLNPSRAAFLEVLEKMLVKVERGNFRSSAGEARGDVMVSVPRQLRSVAVSAREIPSLIDEIPALAVVCAFAEGVSRFEGVSELRVKESDRVAGIISMLEAFGVECRAEGDALLIRGGGARAPRLYRPARDHRLVMACAGLALGSLSREGEGECVLDLAEEAAVSFPAFFGTLESLLSGE